MQSCGTSLSLFQGIADCVQVLDQVSVNSGVHYPNLDTKLPVSTCIPFARLLALAFLVASC